MICPNCGTNNSDTNIFCVHCGARLLDKTPIADMAAVTQAGGVEGAKAEESKIAVNRSETVNAVTPKKRKNPALTAVLIMLALIVAGGIGFLVYTNLPSTRYKKGDAAFDRGNYSEAIDYYTKAGDYKDAADKAGQAEVCLHYEKAVAAIEAADYDAALEELLQTGDYSDSKELARKCHYEKGMKLKAAEDYKEAKKEFSLAKGYSDAEGQIIAMGEALTEAGQYADALEIFEGVSAAQDNEYRAYAGGMTEFEAGEYNEASKYFEAAGDTLDAKDKYRECKYEAASQMLSARQYDSAKDLFRLADGYKDSGKLMNACDLMNAKKNMDSGRLNYALKQLKMLPEGTAYNGVSAADLIERLESNQSWLDLCGTWASTGGKMTSTELTSSYKSWWYHDFEENELMFSVHCILNDDGTCDVSVSGFIPVFINYAKEEDDVDQKIIIVSKKETMEKPGKITVDDNTSVTLGKDKVTLSYKVTEKNNGKKYTYQTDVTYGNRKLEE